MGLRANLNNTTTTTTNTAGTRAKLKPAGKLTINGTIVNHSPLQKCKKTSQLPQTCMKNFDNKKAAKAKVVAMNDSATKLQVSNARCLKAQDKQKNTIKQCKNNDKEIAKDQLEVTVEEAGEDEEEEEEEEETTCITTTTLTTTTFRSNSTSALLVNSMRPQTLNVQQLRQTPNNQTQSFFGEVLNAWRAKARCNVVPAERTQELFHELNFHPSEKQISEMLQTAKILACKSSRQSNGLTFGEFCVLAADLKRFRTSAFGASICDKVKLLKSVNDQTNSATVGSELRSTKSLSNVEDCTKKKKTSITDPSPPVEVFLGGSCNPTTWRADVAIPALNELGISFYNPQVSEWTPDLIELEHRAKEKARVLFFVMDSETRASAGAIEVAHIAGQNCKQLVLVLHPYRSNQTILNEKISQQEYVDLIRNQMILRELVTRRGLPVLENIPSGLQRTKELLAGLREPPSNIASILVVIRGAFDRVSPIDDVISVQQCQRALSYLGYAESLLSIDNLNKIINKQGLSLKVLKQKQEQALTENCSNSHLKTETAKSIENNEDQQINDQIDFDLFCTISAYLSVLQQEIQESGCISPIKGTNVPPPPVYLTNMQGNESFSLSFYGKNISRNSSNNSVPSSNCSCDERQSVGEMLSRSRDSGTSSPQPTEQPRRMQKQKSQQHIQVNYESIETTTTEITTTKTLTTKQTSNANAAESVNATASVPEEESDSNDSVFSSNSSINSVTGSGSADDLLNYCANSASLEFRDVYLGGSCMLRTKWRQDYAIPYLKSKGISFHLPALHESLSAEQMANLVAVPVPAKIVPETSGSQARSYTRTRRMCRSGAADNSEPQLCLAKEESRISWTLPHMRTGLYNPALLDSSRVLLFVITNVTRSLAPMTLAAHCIGLMYNVVLCVQMLPEDCVIGNEKLSALAIKDYNRARSYLIDLAKRQGVPVFNDLKTALECTVQKVKACNSRHCD